MLRRTRACSWIPLDKCPISLAPKSKNDSNPDAVLEELHRVLKPGGILSFSDHYMKEQDIVTRVTKGGMFRLVKKGRKTYCFSKVG